jgi:hypothetical protein
MLIGAFSPDVRREEKSLSRARDQLCLNAGQVSAGELAERNCMISALNPSQARIVRRRVSIDLSACRQMGD